MSVHIGVKANGREAIFEVSPHGVDYLSCEILEYFGERDTTLAAVKLNLKLLKTSVLEDLNHRFPRKHFTKARAVLVGE